MLFPQRLLHRKEQRKIKSKKHTVKRAKDGKPTTLCTWSCGPLGTLPEQWFLLTVTPLPRHPDKNPGSSEDACALIGHTVPCNEAAEEMFIRISKANDACVKPLPAAETYPTTRTFQSSWRELP